MQCYTRIPLGYYVGAAMDALGVLAVLGAWIYPWVVAFRYLRWRGWRWWFGQPAACLWGNLFAVAAMGMMGTYADSNMPSFIFALFITAGLAYATWRMRLKYCGVEAVPAAPPPASALPPADLQAIEAARRQSLAAMRRAAEARTKDKEARNEYDAVPLAGWSPAGPQGSYLAEIEFDYVDARGKASHRRVSVEAVDAEYLEGFCHAALETRTFVVGRVRGKILDTGTGELLAPKKWAAQARRDPRNGEVTMGGESKHDDEYDDEDGIADAVDEILFIGFPKAQCAELEELAALRGMKVVKSVTAGLAYLCAGPNAGPAKINQAIEVGAGIIDLSDFLALGAE